VESTRPTVLVVDDDDIVLDMLARVLEHFGFTVIAENDALQALSTLEECDDIAVLVCDFEMPRLNGEQLARAAKTRRPNLPVFIVSGAHPPELSSVPWDAWFLKGAATTDLIKKLQAIPSLQRENHKLGLCEPHNNTSSLPVGR